MSESLPQFALREGFGYVIVSNPLLSHFPRSFASNRRVKETPGRWQDFSQALLGATFSGPTHLYLYSLAQLIWMES